MEHLAEIARLPRRHPDSNKGDFGKVLVVAGSRGMSGAAVLAGSAALRGGAGLVRMAVPQEILPMVAVGNPCYMTAGLPGDDQGRLNRLALDPLLELAKNQDVLALGPGLGRGPEISELIRKVVSQIPQPLVLDADGLNAYAGHAARVKQSAGPRILTPHPGEFARLLQCDASMVQQHRLELAADFALKQGVILVLKGLSTVVTDGHRLFVNPTGNSGMATAGTGDVLTGLIAALLGQGLAPFAAAQLGVYVHGLAGDLARAEFGEPGLIATDVLQYLPRALRTMQD